MTRWIGPHSAVEGSGSSSKPALQSRLSWTSEDLVGQEKIFKSALDSVSFVQLSQKLNVFQRAVR